MSTILETFHISQFLIKVIWLHDQIKTWLVVLKILQFTIYHISIASEKIKTIYLYGFMRIYE